MTRLAISVDKPNKIEDLSPNLKENTNDLAQKLSCLQVQVDLWAGVEIQNH